MWLRYAFGTSVHDLWAFIVRTMVAWVVPMNLAGLVTIGSLIAWQFLSRVTGFDVRAFGLGAHLASMGIFCLGNRFGRAMYRLQFNHDNPSPAEGIRLIVGIVLTDLAWIGAGVCFLILAINAACILGVSGEGLSWYVIWAATYGVGFGAFYVLNRWWNVSTPSRTRIVRGQQVLDGQHHAQELANRKRWQV